MAIKSPSDYPLDSTPTGTDMFVIEKSGAAGVLERTVRSDVHKLRSGEFIDSSAGVNLLIKSKGTQVMDIGSGSVGVDVNLNVTGTTILQGVCRVNAGIREQTNLEYFTKGIHVMLTYDVSGTGTNIAVCPPLVAGTTTVTPRINSAVQYNGSLDAMTTTVTLLAADGSTYTADSAGETWANLGEDQGTAINTALLAALASFSSGEGRVFTAGDSVQLSHSLSTLYQIVVDLEFVYTA